MSKQSFVIILLQLFVGGLFAACGPIGIEPFTSQEDPISEEPSSEAKPECERADIFCIGLVTDAGSVDDKSFNQSAWEAVQQAQNDMGAVIDFIETEDARDYTTNLDTFALENYDVIVTVGFALRESTIEAAAKYPNIDFIGVDQHQDAPLKNLVGVTFPEDRAGFLAGALAAMVSDDGIIAGVYGTDLVPAVVAFKEGYDNGARFINPDIVLISSYHPGGLDTAFNDPEWGALTARDAIAQGAEVIFGAGGPTGNGGIVEAASHEGVYCIGVDTDQWETLPEARPCLISSAMKLITPAVSLLIQASLDNNLPGGNFTGDADLAPFHAFDDQIPQDVKARLEEIKSALLDGSINTGYAP